MRGRETAPARAEAATLTTLKRDLGKERIGHLDRQKLIDYGKMRAEQGAGPVTLGIEVGVIRMIVTDAAAVRSLDISAEPVDLARVALEKICEERLATEFRYARQIVAQAARTGRTCLAHAASPRRRRGEAETGGLSRRFWPRKAARPVVSSTSCRGLRPSPGRSRSRMRD